MFWRNTSPFHKHAILSPTLMLHFWLQILIWSLSLKPESTFQNFLSLILIFGISSPTDNWIIFCFEWVSSHVPQPLLLVLISHLGNLTSECVIIFQIQYTYYFFKPPPPPPFGLNQNTLHVMTCKCWTFLESKYEKNWSG